VEQWASCELDPQYAEIWIILYQAIVLRLGDFGQGSVGADNTARAAYIVFRAWTPLSFLRFKPLPQLRVGVI